MSGWALSKVVGALASIALCASVLPALVALPGLAVAAADHAIEELHELRDAISDSRERVGSHELRERKLLERLEQVDRRLAGLRRELRESRGRARSAGETLDRVEAERAELVLKLERTQRAMAARVVALYKTGEIGPLRVLFSASSLPELLSRSSTLQTLLSHDAELVARFRSERAAQDRAAREAADASSALDQALAAAQDQSKSLAIEQTAKLQLLVGVRADRSQERALLIELETAARALEDTLRTLGDAPRRRQREIDGLGFAALRGRLPLPVDAEIQFGFGRVVDARFQTETFRKGVEFDAPLGERVRAVARGEVRYAGWFRGYGRIAIMDHGDKYFTVFGHLERVDVEVGEWVESGEGIGVVGETGSLAGPSLYFEIRRGGEPLDPADWLLEVQFAGI